MNKELNELILYVKNTSCYKKCLETKEKMSCNEEICSLISDIKKLQRQYVKSNYKNNEIKKELDNKNELLSQIPIYVEYMKNLEEVNEMIDYIRDDINSYFDDLLNNWK